MANFNTEFTTDQEVEDTIDALMSSLAETAKLEDEQPQIINPLKIQQLLYTFKMIKYATKGTNVKVTYELHKPYKSMGSVSVSGSNLLFEKTRWFLKAIEFASNFEVYPKTDGTCQMNFTFHGLTNKID